MNTPGDRPPLAPGQPGPADALAVLVRTNARQAWRRLLAVRRQSQLLTILIVCFLGGYAVLAFTLFRIGLRFLGSFPGLGSILVERLMFLLFAFLFLLLLFSNLVICYTNLFRNRETQFLMTLPIPAQTIFQWKWIESMLLASWAFLFLIAPLLAAYGLHRHVAWHFYVATPLLIALFIVLPALLGAWVAVHVARYLDRRTFQVLALAGVGLLLAGAAAWLKAEPLLETMTETRVQPVLDRLLFKTKFAEFAWLPSVWLSRGVVQWSEGAWTAALFSALLLLSYALFFGHLAFTRMGRAFAESHSAVHSRGSAFWKWGWFNAWQARRRRVSYHRRGLERVIGWCRVVPADIRALVVKDIRLFWRDTSQWGQTLVLFGLLAAYIINLRHFSSQLASPFWVHLVSYLNLGACALNLATLTTRFVYPQFSLEGKRLWIIGLAPIGLRRVISVKYALMSVASLGVTLGLIWLSCHMLSLGAGRTLYFAGAITVMTLTLNGLAVGLGVLYPNFREDNPSKIVSGFGGTFCLVLSFVYIVASVLLLAVGSPWSWMVSRGASGATVAWTWCAFLALSAGLGWLPFRVGLAHLRRVEI